MTNIIKATGRFIKATWRQFIDGIKSLRGKLNNEQKAGILRHGLTIVGTLGLAYGFFEAGDWEKVAGAILAGATIILSVGSNKNAPATEERK